MFPTLLIALQQQTVTYVERMPYTGNELLYRNLLFTATGLILVIGFLLVNRMRVIKKKQRSVEIEKEKYKTLLYGILPEKIAEEFIETGHVEARRHEQVSVMFTDFAGFTQYAESIKPMELVQDLDAVFSMFDSIIQKRKVEKIKTIGDSYMCCAGLPDDSPTHAEDLLDVALDFLEFIQIFRKMKAAEGKNFPDIRIGMHSGPVVASIIGVSKSAYDIWGDTVNLAQRMELASESGKINITQQMYELVKDKFVCVPRGMQEAKGKGNIPMYFVEGRK